MEPFPTKRADCSVWQQNAHLQTAEQNLIATQKDIAYVSNLEFGIQNPKVDDALGHSSRELDRLSFQSNVFARYTGQLLTAAGLTAGMRVLDLGSGSGDVSFLAADLVGSQGYVLGVDRSPAAVQRATTRAVRRDTCNIGFKVGRRSIHV
jgi:SAM-dependent methyltransferase